MGKKAWIAFAIVFVILVVTISVLILVLIPRDETTELEQGSYESVARQDYTFSGMDSKDLESVKDYEVYMKDIKKGIKDDRFDEGNINPFTPKQDLTIYNEPLLYDDGYPKPNTWEDPYTK